MPVAGHDCDAGLMSSVDWLASAEAGLKLPAEFLSPVADAIRLARSQAGEIERLAAARGKMVVALEKARQLHAVDPADDNVALFIDEALSWISPA